MSQIVIERTFGNSELLTNLADTQWWVFRTSRGEQKFCNETSLFRLHFVHFLCFSTSESQICKITTRNPKESVCITQFGHLSIGIQYSASYRLSGCFSVDPFNQKSTQCDKGHDVIPLVRTQSNSYHIFSSVWCKFDQVL